MADRWSSPSGGEGYHRFYVWPAGSDSYDHASLATNWDTLDGIIGIPSGSNWPPDTGVDGGIYKQIALNTLNLMPIGTVFPWFRPSATIAIPTGCHVCDGTVLTSGNHSFPVAGSVTLPDLINSFWLGADPNLTIGQAGVADTDSSVNQDGGAPGAQGVGGYNAQTLTLTGAASSGETTGNAITGYVQGNSPGGTPTYASFIKTITVSGGSNTQTIDFRPRYVGLIPLCKVLTITTL